MKEQKKRNFRIGKIIAIFSEEYISYTTPPTRNNVERFLLSAERILKVNSQSEFERNDYFLSDMDKNV